jgi:hypothetical protein
MIKESQHEAYEARAKATFSAERKEDIFVLAVAGITVALVLVGVIGPSFVKSLFF